MLSRLVTWHQRRREPAPEQPRHARPRPVPAPPCYREPELDGWMRKNLDRMAGLEFGPLTVPAGRRLADWLRHHNPALRDLDLCRVVLMTISAADSLIDEDRPPEFSEPDWNEFVLDAEVNFGGFLAQLQVAALELSSFERTAPPP